MSNSQSDSNVFSVRIVSIDHYMAPPIPDFDICYSSFQGARRQALFLIKVCSLMNLTFRILNQQFKRYTSLSQTSSDVKMVQSLIPIWELVLQEEYERTGMHETALASDPDRPLPEDVLKILSLGLGHENELMELCGKVEDTLCSNESGFEHSVVPSAEEEYLVGPTNMNSKHTIPRAEVNLPGSLSQHCEPCEKEMNAAPSEENDVYPELLSVGEKQSLETVGTDTEALGLLRWFATSQAAEDVNSDDELVRETILTPLLPATSIEKVLEKASIDYESESQKECQDILDSIGDSIDFEGLNERDSHSFNNIQKSSGKSIPQTDGSSDDPCLSPSAESVENSSKKDIKTELKRSSQDTCKISSTKQKRKRSLWGSLPLSVTEKGKDNSDSMTFKITEACTDGIKEYSTSFSAESQLANPSDPLNRNVHASDHDKQEASALVGLSTWDLMRRKRSRRIEPADCGSLRSESIHLMENKETDVLFFPKQLESLGLHDELDDKASGSLNQRLSLANEQNEFHEAVGLKPTEFDFMYCTKRQSSGVYNPSQTNTGHSEEIGKKLALNFYLKKHDSAISIDAYASKSHEEIYSPDERLRQTGSSGSRSLSASPHKHKVLSVDGYIHKNDNTGGTSLFIDKLVGISAVTDKSCLHKEDCGDRIQECNNDLVVDVDAKPLELIGMTFCKKPPMAYCNDEATENVSHSAATQYSPALYNEANCQGASGSSEGLITAENSSPVNCNEALTEPDSKYLMGSMLDQGHPEKNVVFGSEVKSCGNESIATCQSEGYIRKVNECTNGSQDLSQISGPDGKSRPTPLSQIGFRDPASIGAGQQLTLLSLEVHTESRGDLRPDPRFDAINVIALAIQNDNDSVIEVYVLLYSNTGCQRNLDGISEFKVLAFSEEKHLFGHFTKILCSLDPDVVMGWDIQGSSLGFLAERAAYLGIGLLNKISRIPSETKIKPEETNVSENSLEDEMLPKPLNADSVGMEDAIIEDEWGRTHASGVHVGGRIVLNVWRLMRGEVKLNMYTVEAVAESVLRRKIPSIPYKVLTKWFSSGPAQARLLLNLQWSVYLL
ncbi:hypothetical protein COLO4_13444 [Corchorus olitorius]|uniref:DNA-directed DNA polymerase family B exonuclease domain-containing protein n=1 Tax=Corchorus olitorius TaxID=93759 RepID=A0A1R3JWI3_9ROSI|nr:hypothetical protein COLO4_13444 [Corchorus olitorius]